MLFFIPKPIRRMLYLGMLVALLSVGDVAARIWAEGQLEARAEERLTNVAGVDVSIAGFPFVGRLLALGEVDQLTVRLDEVAHQQLRFASVGVSLHGIAIDRAKVVSDREVELQDLDRGTAFAEITQEELSRVLGVSIMLKPGVAEITAAGRTVQASVAVRQGQLVLIPQGASAISVGVPTDEYLPCVGQVTVLSGRLRVSCTITEIPPSLVRAASRAANQAS